MVYESYEHVPFHIRNLLLSVWVAVDGDGW